MARVHGKSSLQNPSLNSEIQPIEEENNRNLKREQNMDFAEVWRTENRKSCLPPTPPAVIAGEHFTEIQNL